MSAAKTFTRILDAISNAAGDTLTTTAVDCSAFYAQHLDVKVTNGATGPTVAASVQVQLSADNVKWFNLGGAQVASLGNAVVTTFGGIVLPASAKYVRLVVTGNTGQAVVVDADLTYMTGI